MPIPQVFLLKGACVVWFCNCSICFCITSEWTSTNMCWDSWFHFSSGQIRCLLLCGGKLCNWQMDFCYTTSVSWYVVCWTVVSTFLPRRHISRVCNRMSHISRVHLRFATDQCTGSYIIRRAHSQKWMLVKTVSVHEQIESEDLYENIKNISLWLVSLYPSSDQ